MQLNPPKTFSQEKPLGKSGEEIHKISNQNDTVVCYQHLSSYQCKAQHNWKETIFLEQIRAQIIFFLCVLDLEWKTLDYLQSKNHEWIVLIYLAKQSCFPYILCLELPHSRDIQQKQALTPNYFLCFSSVFVLLSLYPGSLEGWEILFIFWKLLAVLLSVVSWGMAVWAFWTAAQGRPRLTTHQPWNSFHYIIGISLRQDSYLSHGMTRFSVLSVLKYQVSELIESRWMFLQKKV